MYVYINKNKGYGESKICANILLYIVAYMKGYICICMLWRGCEADF